MRKVIALLTSFLALISCTSGIIPNAGRPIVTNAESQVFEDWEYEVIDGNIKLTMFNGNPDYSDDFRIYLPAEIDGFKVKAISADAFSKKRTNVCTLVVPDDSECIFPSGLIGYDKNIIHIIQGDFHYTCQSSASGDYLILNEWDNIQYDSIKPANNNDSIMYDVIIPDIVCGYPVKEYDHGMFDGATNISKLYFPESITHFNKNEFNNSSITEVNIPKNVLFVPDGCFNNCKNLKKVIFHDDILVVSNHAFANSSYKLPEKYIDENASAGVDSGSKTVGDWIVSFERTQNKEIITNLSRYIGSENVLTIPDEVEGIRINGRGGSTILKDNETVTEVKFADGVDYCPNLTSNYLQKVTLSDSIENIEWFGTCPELKSLTLPPSVKSLSKYGMRGSSSLSELIIQSDEFTLSGSSLSGTALTELELPGNCTLTLGDIPDTLHTIRFRAGDSVKINGSFSDSAVKNVVFSPNIKKISIGKSAFYNSAIEKLDLPADKVTIGENAFKECNALKEVTIAGDADIAQSSFSDCANLEKVSLNGECMTADYAFANCPELAEIDTDINGFKSGLCFNNCPKLFIINGIEVVAEDGTDIAPEFKDFVMNKCHATNQLGFMDRFIINSAKKVVSEVTDENMNDIQKIKALHDWVCRNTDYDFSEGAIIDPANHVDSSVFLDGIAICEGYARTYNLLLNEAGIETCFVANETHAWNIVKLGAKWYHVDTTWDDGENISYAWFLKSDDFLRNEGGDHATWKLESPSYLHDFQPKELPVCESSVIFGDANLDEKVSVADTVAILQYLGNKDKYQFSSDAKLNADCYNTGDGITGMDALTIQKIDAKIINVTKLPI